MEIKSFITELRLRAYLTLYQIEIVFNNTPTIILFFQI